MKLEKRKKWNYPAIGFAIPCLGMLFLMAVSQYVPFGKYSMLYSDMYHQYYPFFVAFRNALREGRGLLYTWSVGLGMDYLGLIAYYLASPLNLLSVLVPEGWLLGYFSLLVPIKLGLAGLFFSLFLKRIFHRDDFFCLRIRRVLWPVRLGAGLSVERDVAAIPSPCFLWLPWAR